MTTKLEEVARAIALAGNGGTWDDWYNEDQKEFHRKRAKAAIEAMREPTDRMVNACEAFEDFEQQARNWRTMIDAALNEEG
jgi:hypothetical protein